MSANVTRRNDIDGLRGIAVLAVLLFHFVPSFCPGGYVGVDVFFTISGFVITLSLLRLKDENPTPRGFIGTFLSKRVTRILLPSQGIILITLGLAILTVGAEELRETAIGAIWQLFSSFNLREILKGGQYGQASPESKLLLHMWSLAVEEQFYLAAC